MLHYLPIWFAFNHVNTYFPTHRLAMFTSHWTHCTLWCTRQENQHHSCHCCHIFVMFPFLIWITPPCVIACTSYTLTVVIMFCKCGISHKRRFIQDVTVSPWLSCVSDDVEMQKLWRNCALVGMGLVISLFHEEVISNNANEVEEVHRTSMMMTMLTTYILSNVVPNICQLLPNSAALVLLMLHYGSFTHQAMKLTNLLFHRNLKTRFKWRWMKFFQVLLTWTTIRFVAVPLLRLVTKVVFSQWWWFLAWNRWSWCCWQMCSGKSFSKSSNTHGRSTTVLLWVTVVL